MVHFIQISIVHERTLSQTEPSAQSGRAFNSTCRPEPSLGVRNLAPKHVGRKETSCSYQKSCRESREPVSYREPVAGFLATVVIGFGWGGWTLGGTATKMADQSAKNAVVSVLTPICVDNFQHAAAAQATLAELKATDTWKQDTFIEKGGWATFPGMERLITTLPKLVPRCSTP